MPAIPIFNNQGSTTNGSAITANGNFCAIIADSPSSRTLSTGQNSGYMINNATYLFTTAGATTGNVAIQALGADGTWRSLQTPAVIALSATLNYSGQILGTFHGLRLNVSSLAVSTITYAELTCTISAP